MPASTLAPIDPDPIILHRTADNRTLTRILYECPGEIIPAGDPRTLYQGGIITNLAISTHLLLVGFPGAGCARHIHRHVERLLAYANVSGSGHGCPEMPLLAANLASHWKCNHMHRYESGPIDGGFTVDRVRPQFDRVRTVNGIPEPEARI
jgi:hypothetical protein